MSTATVRVALGRTATSKAPAEPASASDVGVVARVADGDGSGADTRVEHENAEETPRAQLVVLAAPVARTAERTAARFGELAEASVVITQGAGLPLAGLLLSLPGLEMTGLLQVAAQVFPPMSNGFYGLRATLLMGVFMALVGEPRAEGATRLRPADLGRLLGLDRAPEVKTLRRKLAELSAHGRGAALQAALGAHHVATRPEAVGFLYLDGHVRVYSGGRELPKTHIARMRIAGPATEETWVADCEGDPVMVVTAAPSQSLAAELARPAAGPAGADRTRAPMHGGLRPRRVLPAGLRPDHRRRVRLAHLLQGLLGPFGRRVVHHGGLHHPRWHSRPL
ncbi:MAG: hypothetical protein DLM59_09660 [Pseudonocardiales bacterium]|nr:MAG: hypothetical protein DLM59_09660 [Pseudonocardiales bacterium]